MAYRTQKQRQTIVEQSLNQKFNELIVEKFVRWKSRPSGQGSPYPMVKCLCSCGKRKIISLWDVRTGRTKTCNLNHPHYKDRSLPAFHQIYNHSYRKRAEKAGIEFTLTKEQFRK